MKLAIISHTEHYVKDGQIVGWGPTVREINELLKLFDEIWHIAPLHDEPAPASSLAYLSDKIHYVSIQPTGGKTIKDKLTIFTKAISTIKKVNEVLKEVDIWQFRAPTGIGVYLIPYLSHFVKKPGWFKYAGNWMEESPPLGYRFQRFWLASINKRKVTINGNWLNQPKHCISFENPCIDDFELEEGNKIKRDKTYHPPYTLCYVGRIEEEKGILRLFKALENYSFNDINEVHIVGNGPKFNEIQQYAKRLKVKCTIYGPLNRIEINEIYKKSHFIVLPSLASEGFPKVLAEAANYGCIPISSDISSIYYYINNDTNGFIWYHKNIDFEEWFCILMKKINNYNLQFISENAYSFSQNFTYKNYLINLKNKILNAK